MKMISLFAGIGGFDIAAHNAGWETVAWCERDPFCQRVLRYWFPDAEGFDDITTADFTKYADRIDVLCGGFPCGPFSDAGLRLGIYDPRYLWPPMLRTILEVRPRWVVAENVRGLVNWSGGLVFEKVQADLESAGYEVLSFILPAAGVQAPHKRDRVWFVAYSNGERIQRQQQYAGDTCKNRQGGKGIKVAGNKQLFNSWDSFPTQSPVLSGNDGIPARLDGITLPKWRNETIKAAGNAIVWQVAYQIFQAINEYESQ